MKISGGFTASSETVTQNLMQMSGMSNRKPLLKDAVATYDTVNNETFQSLLTEQKTMQRGLVQDPITGAYRETQFIEKPIIIKKST